MRAPGERGWRGGRGLEGVVKEWACREHQKQGEEVEAVLAVVKQRAPWHIACIVCRIMGCDLCAHSSRPALHASM